MRWNRQLCTNKFVEIWITFSDYSFNIPMIIICWSCQRFLLSFILYQNITPMITPCPNPSDFRVGRTWVRSRTMDTQWRPKSNISKKLGWYGRANMLRPYLKIWDWDGILGRAVKAISSLGVHSPCYLVKKCLFPIDALVVWCPTWSKNLGRTLVRILPRYIFLSWMTSIHLSCNMR